MIGFEENYWHIPKPQKPLKLERPDRGFFQHTGETQNDLEWTARQQQFLLEMTKFLPESENQVISNYSTTQDIKDDFDFFASATQYDHFQDETMKHSTAVAQLPDLRAKLSLETISRAGLSGSIFKRINDRFDSTNKNFNELIKDYAANPDTLTKEDSFLLLGAMLESRTRLYAGMKDLFGDPNETDDKKRIQSMKSWLESPTLDKDTKRLFFVYLTEFQNVYNRLSTLINPALSEMPDSTEKSQMTDFRSSLMSKLDAYQTDLQNCIAGAGNLPMSQADAQAELDTLTNIKKEWESPTLDGTGWTTQKGNRLLSNDLTKPLVSVNDTIQSLTPSELKGNSGAIQEMVDANNQRITGKAHDHMWSVYAAGEMRKSFDRVVTDSVRVGAVNRDQYNEYVKKMEDYEDKIAEEKEIEFQEKKLDKKKEVERLAESKKLESKAINTAQKRNKELMQLTQKKQQEDRAEQKKLAAKSYQSLKALDKQFSVQNQIAQNNQRARNNSKNQRKAREA